MHSKPQAKTFSQMKKHYKKSNIVWLWVWKLMQFLLQLCFQINFSFILNIVFMSNLWEMLPLTMKCHHASLPLYLNISSSALIDFFFWSIMEFLIKMVLRVSNIGAAQLCMIVLHTNQLRRKQFIELMSPEYTTCCRGMFMGVNIQLHHNISCFTSAKLIALTEICSTLVFVWVHPPVVIITHYRTDIGAINCCFDFKFV